jgi:L-aspartate oxidase
VSTNPAPRVLVVGSGIAGLTAALGAAGHGLRREVIRPSAVVEKRASLGNKFFVGHELKP